MESNFAGQYTKQDLLQAQKIDQLPSPLVRNLRIIGIVAVILAYIAYLFLHSFGSWVDELGVFLPVLMILYVLGNPFILPYTITSQSLKDPDFQGTILGKINDNGVTIITTRSTSELKWDLYNRSVLNNDFIMLYQGKLA
jgi:hypothetical protein